MSNRFPHSEYGVEEVRLDQVAQSVADPAECRSGSVWKVAGKGIYSLSALVSC